MLAHPPPPLHTLEGAPCHDDRSPPRRPALGAAACGARHPRQRNSPSCSDTNNQKEVWNDSAERTYTNSGITRSVSPNWMRSV